MTQICLAAFVVFASSMSVLAAKSEILDGVEATVNGTPILRSDLVGSSLDEQEKKILIDDECKTLGIVVSDEELNQTIENIRKQNSLSAEAFKKALQAEFKTLDYEEKFRSQLKHRLKVSKLIQSKVKNRLQPKLEEKSYDTELDLVQIGLKGEGASSAQEIYLELHKTQNILKDALILKEKNENLSVSQTKIFLNNLNDELAEFLAVLPEKTLSKPFLTADGTYLFFIRSKEKVSKPLENPEKTGHNNQTDQQIEEVFRVYLEELMSGASIRLNKEPQD